MNRLTQALLTLARVDSLGAGETEVVDVTVALRDVVDAVERPKHVDLRVEVEPDLAAKGDPTLLRQVMIGLLTNAFKNTPPPGAVTVRGRRDGEAERDHGSHRHRNWHTGGGDRARLRALLPPQRDRASRRASASAWRSPAAWST